MRVMACGTMMGAGRIGGMETEEMSEQAGAVEQGESAGGSGRRRRRGAAAARARADAARALRARTRALAAIADKWASLDKAAERAAERRDAAIERAAERARARYEEDVSGVEAERDALKREALGLEGATTREIAEWLAVSSRRVNRWRDELGAAADPGAGAVEQEGAA